MFSVYDYGVERVMLYLLRTQEVCIVTPLGTLVRIYGTPFRNKPRFFVNEINTIAVVIISHNSESLGKKKDLHIKTNLKRHILMTTGIRRRG